MTEQHLVQNASSGSMEMRGKSITEEIIQRFSSNKKILTLSWWDNLGHFWILQTVHMPWWNCFCFKTVCIIAGWAEFLERFLVLNYSVDRTAALRFHFNETAINVLPNVSQFSVSLRKMYPVILRTLFDWTKRILYPPFKATRWCISIM